MQQANTYSAYIRQMDHCEIGQTIVGIIKSKNAALCCHCGVATL